jgi:hypothetical protein
MGRLKTFFWDNMKIEYNKEAFPSNLRNFEMHHLSCLCWTYSYHMYFLFIIMLVYASRPMENTKSHPVPAECMVNIIEQREQRMISRLWATRLKDLPQLRLSFHRGMNSHFVLIMATIKNNSMATRMGHAVLQLRLGGHYWDPIIKQSNMRLLGIRDAWGNMNPRLMEKYP